MSPEEWKLVFETYDLYKKDIIPGKEDACIWAIKKFITCDRIGLGHLQKHYSEQFLKCLSKPPVVCINKDELRL